MINLLSLVRHAYLKATRENRELAIDTAFNQWHDLSLNGRIRDDARVVYNRLAGKYQRLYGRSYVPSMMREEVFGSKKVRQNDST